MRVIANGKPSADLGRNRASSIDLYADGRAWTVSRRSMNRIGQSPGRGSGRSWRARKTPVKVTAAAASRDLMVDGPTLAAHAFRAGVVEECHLFVAPVLLGRGKPSLPSELRTQLELLDERRFDRGVVYLRYRIPA